MGKKYYSDRVRRALMNPSYLRVANIIGINYFNSDNDVDRIEKYLKKNGDPYENALAEANRTADDIRNRSRQDLNDLTISYQDSIRDMNRDFSERFAAQNTAFGTAFTDLQTAADERYNKLNQTLQSTIAGFNDRLREAAEENRRITGLFEEQKALVAEQQRMARNQAAAFVPDANPGAQTAIAGDARTTQGSTTKKQQKDLNSLSILSGIGQQANPLAGLQIA